METILMKPRNLRTARSRVSYRKRRAETLAAMTFTPRTTRTARVALSLMVLLFANRGQGTEVIVLVTEGWVVIAADSRFVMPGGASSTGCKIHQSDGRQFFWAASGIFFDKETGYSVDDFFRKVQRGKPLTTPQTLDAVGKLIAGPLLKETSRLKGRVENRRRDFSLPVVI